MHKSSHTQDTSRQTHTHTQAHSIVGTFTHTTHRGPSIHRDIAHHLIPQETFSASVLSCVGQYGA